jgi:hypothetical protein
LLSKNKALLDKYRFTNSFIRNLRETELIRIKALIILRGDKIDQLNKIKNLVNDTLSFNYKKINTSEFSIFYSSKNKYKNLLLKKKFINTIEKIEKIDKTLSSRYFNLKKIKLLAILFKLYVSYSIINNYFDFIGFDFLKEDRKVVNLNFFSLIYLRLWVSMIKKDVMVDNFFKKIKLFGRNELKRRVLRKYYITLFANKDNFKNIKKFKENLYYNYRFLNLSNTISDLSESLYLGFKKNSIFKVNNYGDIRARKIRFLRRFSNTYEKFDLTGTLFWYKNSNNQKLTNNYLNFGKNKYYSVIKKIIFI